MVFYKNVYLYFIAIKGFFRDEGDFNRLNIHFFFFFNLEFIKKSTTSINDVFKYT